MSDFTTHDPVVPSVEHDATANNLQNAKDSIVNGPKAPQLSLDPTNNNLGASAAADSVKNHPITQSIANGPVMDNVKNEHAKVTGELSNLAASKTTPLEPAATGQPLTHYHSFFYSLLSWKNPRASGIAYVSIVAFIFASRYLDVMSYTLKATYMILAVTVLAEGLGKAVLSTGLATQIRPKKYFVVSRDSINSVIGDVHELINFFVIEAQRLVFAENLLASTAALLAALFSYYMIKIVPFWGLCLIGTSVLFGAPLIYTANKELIDTQLQNVSSVVSQQTEQVRTLASQHASAAAENTKSLVGDYSAKAQEMIGNARGRATSPAVSKTTPTTTGTTSAYKSEDFPIAPKEEFKSTPIADTMAPKSEAPLI